MNTLIAEYRKAIKETTDENRRKEYQRTLAKILRVQKIHELVGKFQQPALRISDLLILEK